MKETIPINTIYPMDTTMKIHRYEPASEIDKEERAQASSPEERASPAKL